MKFIALCFLLASSVFATDVAIPVADLPQFILDSVARNAPGATIVDATQIITTKETTYKINAQVQDLDVSYVLYLNTDGSLSRPVKEKGSVSPNKLPAEITAAVNTLTGGASITAAHQDSNGAIITYRIWAVNQNTRYYLVLNADGTTARPIHSETRVGTLDLPTAVANELNSLVPNATISSALKISDGANSVYRIAGTAGATAFTVTLNGDGSVFKPLITETPILASDLPPAVLGTVMQNVSGATITKVIKINNGGNVSYRVIAEDQTTIFTLLMGPDGGLLQPVKSVTKVLAPSVNLPNAVFQTITQTAPGGVILSAKKVTRGAITTYAATVITNVARYRFVLNEDGTFAKPLHIEQALDVTQVPSIIAQAAAGAVEGGTIVNANAVTDGTRTVFHIAVAANGKTRQLTIDAGGVVLHISPAR